MTGETAQVSSASMTTSSRAVFLSYASEDAPAAQRIAEALRAAGIEVWFDREELRGGDAWDRQIREQIHECRLFMPIISAHTEARIEGYFRREWKLAVDRTHDLSERVAFLLPVVIDSTSEQKADVPDAFRHVQWMRLPGGEIPPAFINRIVRLLTPKDSLATVTAASDSMNSTTTSTSGRPPQSSNSHIYGAIAIAVIAGAYVLTNKLWPSKHSVADTAPVAQQTPPPGATPPTFNPPPHSIAVLPFVNMSGDKEQEYFSDGLSEELLNSLARINELQVAARTSSFYFKGEHEDLATIAHKLNVASVLEGSVRRSGHTIRVTAQLNNAMTGFHLWSQTYDRDLSDVLRLQTEIATAVATALKVTLLGDISTKIELGGTHNPAAVDAYLRGLTAYNLAEHETDEQAAIAAYTEALRLDPNYALAFVGRSTAWGDFANQYAAAPAIQASVAQQQADAQKAVALAPELPDSHLALALAYEQRLDFARARNEYDTALALGPGNGRVIRDYGIFAVVMGHPDSGLTMARRAVVVDPLNVITRRWLGIDLRLARRYNEAITAFTEALAVNPGDSESHVNQGLAYYMLGRFEEARSSCEVEELADERTVCLAITYEKLGRRADAEAVLGRTQKSRGDAAAYSYAQIHAQWGDRAKALESLDTAMRLHLPDMEYLKTDPLLDPLRSEPRFQAIERALNFPN